MSTRPPAWLRTDQKIEADRQEFACTVRAGLTKTGQKELHSKFLYDELGSALFDAITFLPEYGLTRADERLLRDHADDIAAAIDGPMQVIELGSGNGRKTRYILNAVRRGQRGLVYHPIDVSPEALARCESELADIADVRPWMYSYLDGMAEAVARRQSGETLLVLFLGSNIGNFERPCAEAFLRDLRRCLDPGDAFLVGADLVKSREQMLLAYDDPTGVTAAFNLNLLGRVNRELGASFDLRSFSHEARYNQQERRIEMHLRSLADQTVAIPQADCEVHLRTGETIWTESSHKFTTVELRQMAAASGFLVRGQWVDEEWPFAESLWIAS